jgi:HlyD family secretion protein
MTTPTLGAQPPAEAPIPSTAAAPAAPAAAAAPRSRARRALAFVRRHLAPELIFLVGIPLAVLAGPRLVAGPQVTVETVVQQDFVQSVVASGRVETPHRVDVGVQVIGTVRAVPVVEGQTVAAGATLIALESSELEASLAQAARVVQAAAAQVRQLREVQSPAAGQALRQAELAHDAAVDLLARNKSLFDSSAISRVEYDAALRAEQTAAAQVRIAQQSVASARPSGSDAAVAQAALAQAQAGAQLARARLGYATVRAPQAGTLIARDVETGDVVQPGKTLMVLSPGGETQLVVQIDEKNLRLLSVGLGALASADAYPAQRFDARVAYVNPGVDALRGAVEVKLLVPSPPAYLKQDMTVSVDIAIARRAQAVLVPVDAVHAIDGASPWVLRVEGRRVAKRAVTIGLRSAGLCEVLSGLVAGDRVVPVATTAITDGARLRAVVAGAAAS